MFFAIPGSDCDSVKRSFQWILKEMCDAEHLSRCVIHKADGDSRSKLSILEDMEDELCSERNFGRHACFTTRLLDGEDWPETIV